MRRCHFCGKILHELPYKCRRCGHQFCSEHHLPENHHCFRNFTYRQEIKYQYCANCGRELPDPPFRCRKCGQKLCDDCQLPGDHLCTDEIYVPQKPDVSRPHQEGIKSNQLTWNIDLFKKIHHVFGKIKRNVNLKNLSIISLILLATGFLTSYSASGNIHSPSIILYSIGFWGFLLAFVVYAVNCWDSGNPAYAVSMLTIPILVYFLSTSKISQISDTTFFSFLVQVSIIAILSAILLHLLIYVKKQIEKIVFNQKNKYRSYFLPRFDYVAFGIVFVSLLVISSSGSYTHFSDNTNQAISSFSNSQISNPIPATTIDSSIPYQTQPTESFKITPTTVFPTTIVPTRVPETGLVTRSLPYVIKGKTDTISVNAYSSINAEISSTFSPTYCVRYNHDPSPCTTAELNQYYLQFLNEPNQKKTLNNIVDAIRSKTPNTDDQARIAISLVQQIPYDYEKFYSISSSTTQEHRSRTPYEVVYDNRGVCGEKSLLLAYLLRELGYGVVLFEFREESHMAVGVKSPNQYSFQNSGFAFVESAGPAIPTDSENNYLGVGKLTSSPQILQISDGDSFDTISEEYKDAQYFKQLQQISISSGGFLDQTYYYMWLSLVAKYGLMRGISSSQSLTSTTSPIPTNAPTCDVTQGRYCPVGLNCCEADYHCYSPCIGGNWNPKDCRCYT